MRTVLMALTMTATALTASLAAAQTAADPFA